MSRLVFQSAAGVEASDEIPLRKVERRIERSGRSHAILRPTWFADNFHTFWRAGIVDAGVLSLPAADARTAFIDARDVAASASAALTGDAVGAHVLTGPHALTYADAARLLSEATGRAIRYEPVSDEAFRAGLVAAGVAADYADLLTGLFGYVRQGAAAAVSDGVRKLTGREPRPFTAYARDRAPLLRP